MPAYLKLGSIKGEGTRKGYADWIACNSMSAPIHRSVQGANRKNGQTTLGDIVVVRPMDKSTAPIAQARATGTWVTAAGSISTAEANTAATGVSCP